ncbi:MAG: acyl carrier protein phosphodiesterase [Flavobacteriales bacterium]|nr:acyl carrier protein phosphodiesterase [Flavobacteriales bacterium]
MVGNFIADTLRGSQGSSLPESILKGVAIHRDIDTFTDGHHLVLETRKCLYPYFGKYAAVVQDVYYDHFLAANWKAHSEIPLFDFSNHVYQTLERNRKYLNAKAERTLYYMSAQNWLYHYRTTEGINRALTGLSRRAKFESNMENAIPPLKKHYEEMYAHFQGFFPELVGFIRREW